MRRVVWNEASAQGGEFSERVRADGVPEGQDIAVLAVPKFKSISIVGKNLSVATGDDCLEFTHREPFTARALVIHGQAKGRLYAEDDGKRFLVAEIDAAGGSRRSDFLSDAVEAFSFADTTARKFLFIPSTESKVVLRSEPVVAQFIEKQMGRMHPTPDPSWESYIFADTVEPENQSMIIRKEDVIDLSDELDADGVLRCVLPAGDWTILYFGMVTTGKKNGPVLSKSACD